MRILHTADLHLGKTVNEFSMLEDQKYLLQQLLDVTAEKKVDAVVISGDIYDRSVPPEDAVSLLDGFLTALSKRGIPVLLVSGNHDSAERLSYGSKLFAKSGIHIAGAFTGTMPCVTLTDAFGPVNFYLLPFRRCRHRPRCPQHLPLPPVRDRRREGSCAIRFRVQRRRGGRHRGESGKQRLRSL